MCKLCWTLLVLLIAVAGVGVWRFMAGAPTTVAEDGRRVIQVSSAERNLVLREMREFLVAVRKIVEAAEKNDMDAVATAAAAAGMKVTHAMPPGLMGKLPLEFKQLGMSVHSGFDQIALDAQSLGDPGHTRGQLVQLLYKCEGCHASFRLEAAGQ